MHHQIMSTVALAKTLGIARATLYYHSRMEQKDWELKCRMEALLREHPAYGSRSIRDAFGIGRQRARRVMRKYGIKPYRRRGRKHKKIKRISEHYPNLLKTTMPTYPHHIWVADFTELWWKHHWVYVATVMDLYTREILGVAVSLRKGAQLTVQALGNALMHTPLLRCSTQTMAENTMRTHLLEYSTNVAFRYLVSTPGVHGKTAIKNRFMENSKLIWEILPVFDCLESWLQKSTKRFGRTTTRAFTLH